MGERKIKYIISIVILAIFASGVVYILSGKEIIFSDVKLLDFPLQIGNWKGKTLPLGDNVIEILGTDKVFVREYTNLENEIVWFSIVYGEQNRSSFHPPEYCYLGSGNVELLDKGKAKIKLNEQTQLDVNKLLFQMGRNKQLVLYWFTAGKKMTGNFYKQQLYFVLDEMRFRKSSGALIRVSTPVFNNDVEDALRRNEEFVLKAFPLFETYL